MNSLSWDIPIQPEVANTMEEFANAAEVGDIWINAPKQWQYLVITIPIEFTDITVKTLQYSQKGGLWRLGGYGKFKDLTGFTEADFPMKLLSKDNNEDIIRTTSSIAWDISEHKFQIGDLVKVNSKHAWHANELITKIIEDFKQFAPNKGSISEIIPMGEYSKMFPTTLNKTGENVFYIDGSSFDNYSAYVLESDIELI
jgi:hypothetical protein